MSQLVEAGFRNPLQEESHVLLLAVVLRTKPVERDDRASALYPSGTEHILENEDEEVDLGDRQNLPGMRGAAPLEPLENPLTAILISHRIKGIARILELPFYKARQLACVLDGCGQMTKDVLGDRAQRVNDYVSLGVLLHRRRQP
jgi:hypothetical protein